MTMTKPTSEQVTFIADGAGATQRTALDKLRDVVSVKDFGAVGDGVADDTASINAAIASSAAGIYFPVGTYLTTGNHVLTSHRVFGSGRNDCTVKRSSGTNPVFVALNAGTLGASISDLAVDGNGTHGHGILVGNTGSGVIAPASFENLIVKNCGATQSPVSVSGITSGTGAVISTSTAHGLALTDIVQIDSVLGVDQIGNANVSKINGGSGYASGGTATYTGVTLTYVSGKTATTYGVATIVVTSGIVSSVTFTTQPTGYATTSAGFGYTTVSANAADLGGTGSGFTAVIRPGGSWSRSLFNTTMQVSAVQSGTQFSADEGKPNSTYSAYVSGGNVRKAVYGICVTPKGGNNLGTQVISKSIRNVVFENNYGHVCMFAGTYCHVDSCQMYGSGLGGCGIFVGSGSEQCTFSNLYMENGVETVAGYGVRSIRFENISYRQSSSSTWTRPWLTSVGFNSAFIIGGENAGLSIDGLVAVRQKSGMADVPLILTNSYQATLRRIRMLDFVSSTSNNGWSVIRDEGTTDCRIEDVVGEGTLVANDWDLFHQDSAGGSMMSISNVDYTQGEIGRITLSSQNIPASTLVNIDVDACVANVRMTNQKTGARGYFIRNISGNLDVTNAANYGTVAFNIMGTVTDPGATSAAKRIAFGNLFNNAGINLTMNPLYTYADNAAAIAAGRVVGEVYRRTSDSALMVVS